MDGQGQEAVLVADDDDAVRLLCRVNLELEGYRVLEAATAAEVDGVLAAEDVAVALLDVHLGSDDGLAVARAVRRAHPNVRIAFLTGSASRRSEWDEISDGYLAKPFSLEDLGATVRRLARR